MSAQMTPGVMRRWTCLNSSVHNKAEHRNIKIPARLVIACTNFLILDNALLRQGALKILLGEPMSLSLVFA